MGDRHALTEYKRKRDFEATPEPAGAVAADHGGPPRFVIQEHHATALHWDLRLEKDGVLPSWAVPKGIPPDPKVNHLAVQTEDHPIEYLDFHGEIPEGSYGAGSMTIWDSGTYEPHEWTDRKVTVTLNGERAKGRYALFKTRGNQWMIHRMDPPEDPGREPLPEQLVPVRAATGPLPGRLKRWSHEVAWGGHVMTIAVAGGRVEWAFDAGGEETAAAFPELAAFAAAQGTTMLVVHAEVVVPGEDGRPDADRLARRLAARTKTRATIRRHADREPATIFVGDLLWLEGHATTGLATSDRRSLLDRLELSGPSWQTVPAHPGEGSALLEAARAQGLPGVLGKPLDAPYGEGWVLTPTA